MIRRSLRLTASVLILVLLMSQSAFAETGPGLIKSGDNHISLTGPTGGDPFESSTAQEPGPGGTSAAQETKPAAESSVETSYAPQVSGTTSQTTPQTERTDAQTGSPAELVIPQNIAEPEISSEAAVLMDATTGQILYSKNADEQLYPASTTKLLTVLVAKEKLDAQSVVTVRSSAVSDLESGAAIVNLASGDTLSFNDALHAILIRSACDAANAVAEAAAGSQEAFALLMNEKAAALGCTLSHFTNATGLNDEAHYSTARDMAIIARAALADDSVREILLKKSYVLPATSSRDELTITNTNKFVTGDMSLDGFMGGKTGYTSKAGQCLATKFEAGGREFIAVVLKASTPAQYTDTQELASFAAKIAAANGGTIAAAAGTGSWETLPDGSRKYLRADGSYCTNEWLELDGQTYFFDGNSLMCKGWKHFTDGSWYFFSTEDGHMYAGTWLIYQGGSYYLNADGTLAVNTVIDGIYEVDENGLYIGNVG